MGASVGAERAVSDAAPSAATPRESVGGALGVLLGLLLIAVAVGAALRPAAREVDGRELLERSFVFYALPFGLELRGAAALPGGEVVVSFAATDRPAASDGPPASNSDSPPSAGAKPDWAALTSVAEGAPPERVLLVLLPRTRAEAERRRRFDEVSFRSLEDLESEGGKLPLERERLPWQGYVARAVRERSYRLAVGHPTFQDAVRVDLARPGQAWMLVAIWPERSAASLAPVRTVLEAFAPR